ncbi:MAG: prenyltransferase [Halobacteriales archaeon]|nr:prenyltransferase [Halobacteriales archaeon]
MEPSGDVRVLAWHHLEQVARQHVPDWDALRAQRGWPDLRAADPFDLRPIGPYLDARRAIAERIGAGPLGRGLARAWARAYRSAVRQCQGEPGKLLALYCSEVRPWLLGAPPGALDAGPASIVADVPGADAVDEGLLAGLAEAAGARDVRVAAEGARLTVTWERAARRTSPWAALVRAARPGWWPATLVPVLIGAALAWKDEFFDPFFLGLCGAGALAFTVGTNLANDWFDHRSRSDEGNLTPTPFSGGSRVIQEGLLSPRAVLGLAGLAYAAGAAIGLAIALQLQAQHGTGLAQVLGLGVAGFALGFLFSAPPVHLAHRGLGELAVGLGFGPLVTAGTYLVLRIAGSGGPVVTPEAWLLGVPVGALVAATLLVQEFPDAPWDARAGKRTLVVRLRERAVLGYALLLALTYASIALAALLFRAWPVLLALLTLPLAIQAWRGLRAHHAQPYRLVPTNVRAIALHLATGLLLSAGLLLSRVPLGA